MKKTVRFFAVCLCATLCAVLAVFAAGCKADDDEGVTDGGEAVVEKVVILWYSGDWDTPTVCRSDRYVFLARVEGIGNPSQAVTWSIKEPVEARHSGTAITNTNSDDGRTSGNLKVDQYETLQKLTVVARSVADPAIFAEAAVTIPVPVLKSLDMELPLTFVKEPWDYKVVIRPGDTEYFFLKDVEGSYNPPWDIDWTIVEDDIDVEANETTVTITVMDEDEEDIPVFAVTVPQNTPPGTTFTVRAKSEYNKSVYKDSVVTVGVPEILGLRVLISPAIERGKSVTAGVEVFGTGRVDQSVLWSLVEPYYQDPKNSLNSTSIDPDTGLLKISIDEVLNRTLRIRATSKTNGQFTETATTLVSEYIPPVGPR